MTDTPTYDLNERMGHFVRLLHRYHMKKHAARGPMGDPSRGQGRLLRLLKMLPEISQKDLSYLLDMRPQSMGELLLKLEKNGFIERSPSEDDRRVMNIRLTEEGKKEAGTREETGFSDFNEIISGLDEDEKKTFGGLIDKIASALENTPGKEDSEEDFRFRAEIIQKHFARFSDRRGSDRPSEEDIEEFREFFGRRGGPGFFGRRERFHDDRPQDDDCLDDGRRRPGHKRHDGERGPKRGKRPSFRFD